MQHSTGCTVPLDSFRIPTYGCGNITWDLRFELTDVGKGESNTWGRLTVLEGEAALTVPGRYGDGGTLHLVVSPRGTQDPGFSGSPSMAERRDHRPGRVAGGLARRMAREPRLRESPRTSLTGGRDPLAHKRPAEDPDLPRRPATSAALEANRARWRNAKTADQLDSPVDGEVRAYPVFGDRRVEPDRPGRRAARASRRSGRSKPEIGRKVRQRIRATLGLVRRRTTTSRTMSPARRSTPPSRRRQALQGALPRAAVPRCRGRRSTSSRRHGRHVSARACLRFVVLTACRSGEARLATWGEIDLDAREWRIPAVPDEDGH